MFYREIPIGIAELLEDYRPTLTKPQFANFGIFVSGLIVHENKTIQEINDAFSEKDQSSLNRFVTESEFDMLAIDAVRINQIRDVVGTKTRVIFVADDSMAHKTGRQMEKANYHRSGTTKRVEWGHNIVDSLLIDPTGKMYPFGANIYLRKMDCDENNVFKTKREIAIKQLEHALKCGFHVVIYVADSGYYSSTVCKELRHLKVCFVLGVVGTTKISIDRKKRIAISDYVSQLSQKDYTKVKKSNGTYYIHTVKCYIRGSGSVKLILSYKKGEEEDIRAYVTDILDKSDSYLMECLLKRWNIECFHRDAKQHLGIEDYQVRKYRGIQIVVLAVLVAYTLLVLGCLKNRVIARIAESFGRPLKTIGELCRFMKLSAMKGRSWILRMFREKERFRMILNRYVLVKNAKV